MAENSNFDEEKALSPKQYTLIEALVAGNTIIAAAKFAGVGERTAHTWLKQPAFRRAYQQAKQELFTEKMNGLKDEVHLAIATLKSCMTEGKPYTRVMAASKWLDIAIDIHKMN